MRHEDSLAAAPGSLPRRRANPLARGSLLLAATVALAAAASLLARLYVGVGAPLWVDESGTGAFASSSSLARLTQYILGDSNAPVYYYFIWFWAQVFGVSDVALHVPSVVFGALAPLLAWFGLRRSHPTTALVWSVALGVWGPGIVLAGYARCYSLLLCAATVSTVAHWRLLDKPTLRRAAAWTVCAALMTLTHYYAGILALVQGVVFVMLYPRQALRSWPAALAFVPVFAWIAWHAPKLLAFALPEAAWYHLLSGWDVPVVLAFAFGVPWFLLLLFATAMLCCDMLARRGDRAGGSRTQGGSAGWWAGGAALAAATACVCLGFLRPTFTWRYLVPFVPGILLLISLRFAAVSAGRRGTLAALVACYVFFAAAFWSGTRLFEERKFSFEAASAWLAETAPSHLVFFWDNPAARVMGRDQLEIVGGFFLRRSGSAVTVRSLVQDGADMNGRAAAEAGSGGAILWLYDTFVHGTSAREHPPRLRWLSVARECRDFGSENIGIVACRPRTDARTSNDPRGRRAASQLRAFPPRRRTEVDRRPIGVTNGASPREWRRLGRPDWERGAAEFSPARFSSAPGADPG